MAKPEELDKIKFSITFKAEGWTEKLVEPTDKHKDPPNKVLITKVSGTNPGYGATCTMLLLSAITILKESDKIPVKYVFIFNLNICNFFFHKILIMSFKILVEEFYHLVLLLVKHH